MQLGRGNLLMKSLNVFGRDALIIRFKAAPLLTGYNVPDPDWIGFMIPLSWEGDYVFNGHTTQPGEIFLTSSRDGYVNIGRKRNTLMFGIRKQRFLATLSTLSGDSPLSYDLSDRTIPLDRSVFREIVRAIEAAIANSAHSGNPVNARYLPPPVENDIVADFALKVAPHLINHDRIVRARRSVNAVDVVRRAENAIQFSVGQDIGLSDLCARSGVGVTQLSASFSEIYGVSPGQYLKHVRLTRVNQWLLDRTDGPRSVKEAARTHGFGNNGRFARYYHDFFRELPSETLARTRARAATPSQDQ